MSENVGRGHCFLFTCLFCILDTWSSKSSWSSWSSWTGWSSWPSWSSSVSKSSEGILAHKGHISQVNANVQSVSESISQSHSSLLERLVTLIMKGKVENTFQWPVFIPPVIINKLRRIVQDHQNMANKYPCTMCVKSFLSPSKLAIHMLTHTGEKLHKCAQS